MQLAFAPVCAHWCVRTPPFGSTTHAPTDDSPQGACSCTLSGVVPWPPLCCSLAPLFAHLFGVHYMPQQGKGANPIMAKARPQAAFRELWCTSSTAAMERSIQNTGWHVQAYLLQARIQQQTARGNTHTLHTPSLPGRETRQAGACAAAQNAHSKHTIGTDQTVRHARSHTQAEMG